MMSVSILIAKTSIGIEKLANTYFILRVFMKDLSIALMLLSMDMKSYFKK